MKKYYLKCFLTIEFNTITTLLFCINKLRPREWPYKQVLTSLQFPHDSPCNSIFHHKHQSETYISHLDALHNVTPYIYFPVALILR
jgi:hypothetical protein